MLAHLRIFSLFCFALISVLSKAQSGDVPVITAEGDQFYCPGSEINVVTDFDISGPADLDIDAFYIQISSGYSNGDILTLKENTNGLVSNWDPVTGKLSLRKPVGSLSYQEIIEAVQHIVYIGNDPEYVGEKFFSFTLDDANFLPSTGHFYEYVEDIGVTWTQARMLAEEENYYGLPGYLATITSPEEAQLSGEQS